MDNEGENLERREPEKWNLKLYGNLCPNLWLKLESCMYQVDLKHLTHTHTQRTVSKCQTQGHVGDSVS